MRAVGLSILIPTLHSLHCACAASAVAGQEENEVEPHALALLPLARLASTRRWIEYPAWLSVQPRLALSTPRPGPTRLFRLPFPRRLVCDERVCAPTRARSGSTSPPLGQEQAQATRLQLSPRSVPTAHRVDARLSLHRLSDRRTFSCRSMALTLIDTLADWM